MLCTPCWQPVFPWRHSSLADDATPFSTWLTTHYTQPNEWDPLLNSFFTPASFVLSSLKLTWHLPQSSLKNDSDTIVLRKHFASKHLLIRTTAERLHTSNNFLIFWAYASTEWWYFQFRCPSSTAIIHKESAETGIMSSASLTFSLS